MTSAGRAVTAPEQTADAVLRALEHVFSVILPHYAILRMAMSKPGLKLVAELSLKGNMRILDVGTGLGAAAAAAAHADTGNRVLTIDPFPPLSIMAADLGACTTFSSQSWVNALFRQLGVHDQIQILPGILVESNDAYIDRWTVDWAQSGISPFGTRIVRNLPSGFDLAIIDANHTPSGVAGDLMAVSELLKIGGLVVLDDCGNGRWGVGSRKGISRPEVARSYRMYRDLGSLVLLERIYV